MPPSVPNGLLSWPSRKPASRAGSCRPTVNIACRCSFRGVAATVTAIDCPRGVAPERMPKADATGLAPEKSADHNPPAHDSFVREGLACAKSQIKSISLVKSLSGGLGLRTRRPPGCLCRAPRIPVFFALLLLGYRSCLHRRVSYPARVLRQHRRPVRQKKESENAAGN